MMKLRQLSSFVLYRTRNTWRIGACFEVLRRRHKAGATNVSTSRLSPLFHRTFTAHCDTLIPCTLEIFLLTYLLTYRCVYRLFMVLLCLCQQYAMEALCLQVVCPALCPTIARPLTSDTYVTRDTQRP